MYTACCIEHAVYHYILYFLQVIPGCVKALVGSVKMFTAICKLDLLLMESTSLKEKRRIVRSIVERLKNRFNISIAEVGHPEALRRTALGLALVSNETAYLERMLDKVINFVESDPRVQIIDLDREIY